MVHSRKRPGLKEVAALAGTSTATASRAISGKGYVAEETRQRVLKAVQELSYQPNLQARALRKRSSSTVGLVIPNLLNAYYTTLADSLSQLLYEKGYHLLLASTGDDPEIEQNMLTDMVGRAVDGIIWVPSSTGPQMVDYLLERHIPAVSIVRRAAGDKLDAVLFEDLAGSLEAVQHLIQLGHSRIGFIGGDIRFSSNHDRWQGYLKAMEEAELEVEDELVKLGTTRSLWGERAASELISLPNPPTAMFVASNAMMPGVLKTLRQRSIHLPDQMSLICFDDLDWFTYSIPSISAITSNHVQFAEAAANLLMKRIESPKGIEEPATFVSIKHELVIRQSTTPPQPAPA